ncbi:MAG: T9SS type A sorting domain-containing protein [Chitinophagaceae bacterium]
MKSLLTTLVAVLSLYCVSLAQTPKYMVTIVYPNNLSTSVPFLGDSTNQKAQILYPKGSLNMPSSTLTAIYFKVFRLFADTTNCGNLTLSLKTFPPDTFIAVTNAIHKYVTGMTEVMSPNKIFTGLEKKGDWVKFPFTTRFPFNQNENLVVQITRDIKVIPMTNGAIMENGRLASNFKSEYISGKLSDTVSTSNEIGVLNIGFDVLPTSVDAVSNIKSFGLFPNPSTDGRFNVSFDCKESVQNASITVANITGQVVYTQVYHQPGNSFFKEINLGGAAKGIYFMELRADGERVVRRVVLE